MPQIHSNSKLSTENQPLHVLVVEDDLVFNTFYKKFLGSKSAVVISCTNLADAVVILAQTTHPFDAVILDNQLSDGEGISLLPSLQQCQLEPAVIMVSGNDDPEFFLTSFAAGIDDYMVKPVNLDLLWLKINKAVNQRRLSRLSAEQHAELEIWVEQEQQQQMLAKHLFDTMFLDIHQAHPAIHVWMRPSGVFSGDAVLHCQAMDGSWYFIMADAMGHGLAPAVSLMPLMQHFQLLVAKSLPLANIVFDLNGTLNKLLPPDRFVAAILFRLDPWRGILEVWNAGMPALQCLNQQGEIIARAVSTHMALGVLGNHQISAVPQVFKLQDIAYLLMFSDGLTETMLPEGQMLESQHIAAQLQLNGSEPLSALCQLFQGVNAEDDISVCLVDCGLLFRAQDQVIAIDRDQSCSFATDFRFRGGALRTLDLSQQVVELLRGQNLPQAFLQRVFTVLTELYVNALEHGVLQLDSTLKDQPEGFCLFYEEKERRLQQLGLQHFIELQLNWSSAENMLQLRLKDSGTGFISVETSTEQPELGHGRGFKLIRQLSQQFDIISPGNGYVVLMSPEQPPQFNDVNNAALCKQ